MSFQKVDISIAYGVTSGHGVWHVHSSIGCAGRGIGVFDGILNIIPPANNARLGELRRQYKIEQYSGFLAE